MRNKLPVEIRGSSPAPSEKQSLDNKAKTSLRERSMKSENNYPGVER